MEPTDRPSENSARFRVLAPELERDVNCAAAWDVPVLISGDLHLAEWLARLIHSRSGRTSEPFVIFRPGKGDQVGEFNRHLNETGPRGTLFVAGVSGAEKEVQILLRHLLALPELDWHNRPRVIAGANQDLFELVERREFDDELFYRLNKIHIKIRDGEKIARAAAREHGEGPAERRSAALDVAAFRRHRAAMRAGHPKRQVREAGTTG